MLMAYNHYPTSRGIFGHLAEVQEVIDQARATVASSRQLIERSKRQLNRSDRLLGLPEEEEK
jgi:hypothetical protein